MVETGKESLEEEYSWIHEMEDVKSKKYLGDILSCDGKNLKNITERKNRGIGIVTQIMTKLEDIQGHTNCSIYLYYMHGNYLYETQKLLKVCLLLNLLILPH